MSRWVGQCGYRCSDSEYIAVTEPEEDVEVDPADLALHAFAFLSAGGVLTLEDWFKIEEEDRQAFIRAHRAIEDGRIEKLTKAMAALFRTGDM